MNKDIVLQRLYIAALGAAIAFLGIVYGIAAHEFKLWPYPLLKNAHKATRAWYTKLTSDYRRYPFKVHHTEGGIFRYNEEKAYSGLTLFTSGHAQKAFLISMAGQIVHEWHLPFSSVDWTPRHKKIPVSDNYIHWRKAHLYPNGDLLAIYEANDTPWGYGLVKVDKNSEIIWSYAGHVHHDVDVGNGGKIYTLIHEIVTEKIQGIRGKPPLIEDSIVVLSPNGQEIKRISISKALRNSDFSDIMILPDENKKGDLWHTNTVEVLDEQMAKQFPFLEQGQVLTSMREIDTIAVVDLDKEQVVWATRGPWHRQHDPDFLANGNMLLFDNRGHYGKGGLSKVVEFDPATKEIIWQYTGNEQDIFYSYARASQQRLPNGNTLITESRNGRIFEVTQDKEIVWEFITPFRSPSDSQFISTIHWGERFHPDDLNFEFSNLKQNVP